MHNQSLNLFIVDDNKLMVAGLRNYLDNKFGADIKISTFYTGESALKKVDENTGMVILDYFLDGENGNNILISIKKINPRTEVIMLTSNENIGIAIDAFRKGASDYLIKGESAWRKLIPHVYKTITEPIRRMGKEFGFQVYTIIFITIFILMGAIVLLALKMMPR